MPISPSAAPPFRPLSPLQQRFVQEYLITGTATAAARRAGYSESTARHSSSALLHRPAIQAAIAAERARRAAPLTREAAIEGLRAIASANVLDYARPGKDGALELDLWRLERDRGAAIETVLKILEAEEAGRRMTAGQARIDAALKAREARLDALAEDLDAEREALDEDRARIIRDGQRLEQRLFELAAAGGG